MSVRNLKAILGMLLLAGCAGQPPQGQTTTVTPMESTSSDTDTDIRSRARIRTELAAGYFEARNMGVALEEILTAIRTDSTYGPAYNIAGLIYAELRDDRQAEQHFQQALRINPADPDANNNYGLFLCERGREEQGIKHFLDAVRNPLYQAPDRSYVNAGLCALRRKNNVAAEEYFRSALKTNSVSIPAIYQLAQLAYLRGSFVEARAHLTRLLPVAAQSPEILWLALRTERKLGEANAEASFALQLRRNFPNSREAQALEAGRFE